LKHETVRNVAITAVGAHLPEEILDNAFFENILDTSDEWIRTRSGVVERRRCAEDEATSDLGAMAAREICEMRGIEPGELDMIINATVTPDHLFPSAANLIQWKLGAAEAPSYDLLAACSGFMYGLTQGYAMVACGLYDKVMVLGSEAMSRIMNYKDRSACFLFGDAAAGVLLEPSDEPGIHNLYLGSDGSHFDVLHQKTCGSRMPVSEERLRAGEQYIYMEGREVFKHAVRRMAEVCEIVLGRTGWSTEDVDMLFAHQANIRIVDATVKRLKLDKSRNYVTIDKVGNTTSASIPYGMYAAYKEGKLKFGDKVLLTAFGGGFTWGGAALTWKI
jgi:3-oxoacyl-[acyl-carrier-protein] synthase-3